jgi:hypothetical protein
MDLKEIGCEDGRWMDLAQNRDISDAGFSSDIYTRNVGT